MKELPAEYKVGIEEMDHQHIEIILILSDIQQIVDMHIKSKKECKKKDFLEIVTRLRIYVRNHFSFEANKMKLIKYNLMDDHLSKHKDFIEFINELEFGKSHSIAFGNRVSLSAHKSSLEKIKKLAGFCKSWFLEHILGHDKMLAEAIIKFEEKKEKL